MLAAHIQLPIRSPQADYVPFVGSDKRRRYAGPGGACTSIVLTLISLIFHGAAFLVANQPRDQQPTCSPRRFRTDGEQPQALW